MRAAAIKTVTIPNIALVQDDPPYTLYRISLIDVAGAFPASPQAASSYVYEPVADNIRTMTFRYYDDSGAELGPNTPGIIFPPERVKIQGQLVGLLRRY